MLPRIFEFLIINSLYYRVVVIRSPLQGLCYNVKDAVDWFATPTVRRFTEGSDHSPLRYCLSVWDLIFSAYLATKHAKGKHYNVVISHAAKKLVRLIFAMEKSWQPYRNAA